MKLLKIHHFAHIFLTFSGVGPQTPHSLWGYSIPPNPPMVLPLWTCNGAPPPPQDSPGYATGLGYNYRRFTIHFRRTCESNQFVVWQNRTCQEGMWLLCCAVVGDVRHYVTSLWTRSRHFHSQHTFTFRFFFFFTATAIWISGRSLRTELRAAVSFPLCNRYSIDICGRTVNGRRPRAITLWSTLISSLPPVDRLAVVV